MEIYRQLTIKTALPICLRMGIRCGRLVPVEGTSIFTSTDIFLSMASLLECTLIKLRSRTNYLDLSCSQIRCPSRTEDFMTILARLDQWNQQGAISPEQHTYLSGLCRREPFSLFLELSTLLYAGVLAFVVGLGWTVTTWSQQLGDVVVLTVLSAILAACFWYCFSRVPDWSLAETPSPTAIFDYVLYLGSLVWCV